MKSKFKFIFLIFLILVLSLSAVACNKGEALVSFDVEGSVYYSVRVPSGRRLTALPAAPEKSGYRFDAWYLDKDVWTQPFSLATTVIGDITVYARFIAIPVTAPRTFTVTYDSMGGSDVASERVKEGASPVLPDSDPTRVDYNFGGWFLDKAYTVPFGSDYVMRGDVTVFAKWTEVDSTVYFSHSGSRLTAINERGKQATVLTLPETLDGVAITTIGDELFKDNVALTKITIPVGYTTIGTGAFKNCTSLATVNIGNSVVDIGAEAFYGCRKIENLQLSTELKTIPDKMCYGCTSLKYLNVGAATSIGEGAYYGCTALTSAAIPSTVKTIAKEAFRECSGLTTVAFKTATVNGKLEGVTSIGEGAFRGAVRATYLALPDTVTSIGAYAFYGMEAVTDLVVGAGITELPAYCFYGMKSVTDPDILGEITTIGDSAMRGMSSLKSVTLPDSLTSIGASAFYNCNALTEVVMPSSITSLKENVFANCVKLTTLDISAVTEIGNGAFYACYLYAAVLPDGLTRLEASAFKECKSIKSVTIPTGITEIPDSAFRNCTALTEIIFHNGITKIGANAFDGCFNDCNDNCYGVNCGDLKSLTLPDALVELGSQCFANCTRLGGVTVSGSTANINATAFYGCTALEGIDVSADNSAYESVDGVLFVKGKERIALYPYGKKATSYVVPVGVKYITDSLFKGNSTLTEVVLPEGLETIEANAFYECGSLTSINFPSTLTSIGQSAFYSCGKLTEAVLNFGILAVESEAFRNCVKLERAVLPATLISVSPRIFRGAYAKLAIEVDFADSDLLSGWSGIWNDSGRSDVTYAVTYAKAKEANISYEYIIRDGKAALLKYLGSDTVVTVPSTIDGAPVAALAATFENNTDVISVSVPNSVEVITERTFNGCTSLESLSLPFVGAHRRATGVGGLFGYIFDYSEDKQLGWTEHYALGGSQSKYYCNIPTSVVNVAVTDAVELAYGAFHNVPLSTITLSEGLEKIGTYALFDIAADNIYIPSTVRVICERAIRLDGRLEVVKDENDNDITVNVAEINCAVAVRPEGWAEAWYIIAVAKQRVTVNYGVVR